MALDVNIVGRILAGAGALAEQAKAGVQREKDLKAQLDAANAQLGEERAAEATEDASDEQANKSLSDLADAVDALVKGSETPAVVVPAPEDAVDVVTGATPVETPDGGAVSEDPAPSTSANDGEFGTV